MSVTVSAVAAAFKGYIRDHGGKARFKLAITSPSRTIVSTKSFEYESNLTQILSDYAAGKNGQTIESYAFEHGVRYKINGTRFASNYIEVVIKVSDIVAFEETSRLTKFLNSESRTCHDRNSRDKHVLEMIAALEPVEVSEPVEGRGEDE